MKILLSALLALLPSVVTAQQTITFGWDVSQGAEGYVLYTGAASGQEATSLTTTNTSASILFQPGTYYVHVRAFIGTNFSGPSNELTVVVVSTPPHPPPPTDPCVADPLLVTVTSWPTRRTEPVYTSNYPVTYKKSTHGQRVDYIDFTDARSCTLRVLPPGE